MARNYLATRCERRRLVEFNDFHILVATDELFGIFAELVAFDLEDQDFVVFTSGITLHFGVLSKLIAV